MNTERQYPGTIITFYSYKGGTGRSMAVANAASWLGKKISTFSQKVLVVDWDLEAPGLHRFFTQVDHPENVDRPGIINYFERLQKKLIEDRELYKELEAEEGWKILDRELPLDEYLIRDVLTGVDFIKAGEFNSTYAELVSTFSWVEFLSQFGNVIETFRNLITSRYEYCLIDSRTGFTDISGICTMLMPEKLVMVFTPSRQSLSGVIDLAGRATAYRRASGDFRPLSIFPLPSRIENAELSLKKDWRERYQAEFEETFRNIYQLEKCELSNYFDEVQLPQMAYYAYGESIAMLEERSDALSLSRAYENFFQRLLELDFPWDGQDDVGYMPEEQHTEITLASKAGLSKYTDVKLISYANQDIFFSYADDDNAYIAEFKGFIDRLAEYLTIRLTHLIGESPKIWRDRDLDAASDTLVIRLSQPKFLVVVLSPSYLNSSWCLNELKEFCNQAIQRRGSIIVDKPPIFKVVKSPVEYNHLPPYLRDILQASLSYEFYEIDMSSGRFREYWPEFGPDYRRKFLERAEDLAQDIKMFVQSKPSAFPSSGEKTVFLAETTPDLSEERKEIRRALVQHGYYVLPDADLPFEESAFEKAVRRYLEQCRLSIHLIGADQPVNEEHPKSALSIRHELAAERVRKQHELAMSRGYNDAEYSRLIWIPEGCQTRTPAYQDFVSYLQNDPAVHEGAEVVSGISFEDLKTFIHKTLERKMIVDSSVKRIYLIGDKSDIDLIEPLKTYLKEQKYRVLLAFDDGASPSRTHSENLRLCDAILIFYGRLNTMAFKLPELRKVEIRRKTRPLLAKGIYISGPETEDKKAFQTTDALVIKNFGEFSPESIEPFLKQIEEADKGIQGT